MFVWLRLVRLPFWGAMGLALTACGDGGAFGFGSGDGAPVNAQMAHMNGAVLHVQSIRRSGTSAVVAIRIMNGHDSDIQLLASQGTTYLMMDNGDKVLLVPSPTNPHLTVPADKMMHGDLVFAGALPETGQATLVINANGSVDSGFNTDPRFEVTLSLDGAGVGASAIPERSALSHMAPLPVSRFGPAAPEAHELQMPEKPPVVIAAYRPDRGAPGGRADRPVAR